MSESKDHLCHRRRHRHLCHRHRHLTREARSSKLLRRVPRFEATARETLVQILEDFKKASKFLPVADKFFHKGLRS